MSGEEVAQLWIYFYGKQILDDEDVVDELELQGYRIRQDDDED